LAGIKSHLNHHALDIFEKKYLFIAASPKISKEVARRGNFKGAFKFMHKVVAPFLQGTYEIRFRP
jgi:hypothetical protein